MFDTSLNYGDEQIASAMVRLGLVAGDAIDDRDSELLHFCLLIMDLEALDARGDVDWGALNKRPDVDPEFWARKIDLTFGCRQNSTKWLSTTLTLGAFAYLCGLRANGVTKDYRGIVLSSFKTHRRITRDKPDSDLGGITSLNGVSLDDDGVNDRDDVNPSCLVISYPTASDGKSNELVEVEVYQRYAKKIGLPLLPTNESMSRFINMNCKHGDAYKAVTVEQHSTYADKPAIKTVKGTMYFVVHFKPQERTRYDIAFERPITGELLAKLLNIPHGIKRLVERIEYEALGIRGTDPACFEPARIGFLPSGDKPNFAPRVIGPARLFDPVPLAEKIVAETPARATPRYQITPCKAVPPDLVGDLRGVRLASLIADAYPELVHSENGLSPLILRECPYCHEHGSKRGQADNSLFCYDPGTSPYPTMRCRHQTCADRTTEELVHGLIEFGELDAASVFNNPDYRDHYEEASPEAPALITNWRALLK